MLEKMVDKKAEHLLIIHPEGNILNNSNLFGIAEILTEEGFRVDVVVQKDEMKYQTYPSAPFTMYPLECLNILLELLQTDFWRSGKLEELSHRINDLLRKYALIIAVDREGVLLASEFSKISTIPFALISYELTFANEMGRGFKEPEIEACREISFAICQDPVRSKNLSEENGIPLEKILEIPFSARKIVEPERSTLLRDRFHLSEKDKIVLLLGTLATWSGLDEILCDLDNWPANWKLVLHNRYLDDSRIQTIQERISAESSSKVFFSRIPFENFKDVCDLPLSADIGVGLYFPQYFSGSPLGGRNLEDIGWSSGKIATYLQCGLPVVVNEIGAISEAVRKYNLGYVLGKKEKFSSLLNRVEEGKLGQMRTDCRRFFERFLDLDLYGKEILKAVKGATHHTSEISRMTWNDMDFALGCLREIQKHNGVLTKRIQQLEKSPIFRLEDYLSKAKSFIQRKLRFFKERLSPSHNVSIPPLRKILDGMKNRGFYPKTIIDVGFAQGTLGLFETFPSAFLLLIDPLVEYEETMQHFLANRNGKYFIAAAGRNPGEQKFNVHLDHLDGSSLLKETSGKVFDGIEREVTIITLDAVTSELRTCGPYLLKIDVQGSELEVLNGSRQILPETEVVVLEVSLFSFMENSPQFHDVIKEMKVLGFVVYEIYGLSRRPLDGALGQVDMVFVRENGIFRQSHAYCTVSQWSDRSK